MSGKGGIIAILALAMVVGWVSRGFAQTDDPEATEARRLYNEARQAFKQERYREAALGFEAASKIRPHAVALYIAAQAWELAQEPVRAADAYARALSTPKLEEEQAARARERLDALEPELATALVAGREGTRVRLDDRIELTVP